MLSFSFLSDMSLSCVFFKKVAENRSVGCVFLHSRESNFLPQNHSQTTSALYLFINSFTHNNTYYKTTRIKIHHSERRRAKKRKRDRVCCCFISLKLVLLLFERKRARAPFFF